MVQWYTMVVLGCKMVLLGCTMVVSCSTIVSIKIVTTGMNQLNLALDTSASLPAGSLR